MYEIKRTNESEKYNVTVDWLNDFINKIARNAPPIPPLSLPGREKFATIEDKMQDIKARIGFNSLVKTNKELDSKIKVESSSKCDCGKKDGRCTCGKKKVDSEKVNKLKNILNYITAMIASEPHLFEPEIRSRCIENKDLGFESLNINPKKLKKFIEGKKGKGSIVSDVIYIKPSHNTSSSEEDIADYFKHGLPASR